ncbi:MULTISPECIES: DUF3040 domain-containing protein [Actinopolyspora]|uniref:DUF3040 domain-containing protein n=1 Tax=Actinopolyspora saharensis TaxID=995062 RepID=A0A1H1A4K7_9ACTN|nr:MULTISPECIES: DUF3040 domain-containing protein [Actinopolyspora]NHD16843.1 DUF3040 domain-containing protein [Actinopolyspora sp. BKK2]NHE75995.1 DUF3040 domain-containing protein [Actinopolyspora sp. BKK1]SDQ34574.1 Protein of unknown function [Actinopolyspora saharensis]
MLDRDERRRLDEIEQHLSGDDPDLAELMTGNSPHVSFRGKLTPRTVLIAFSYGCALLCLLLGAGGGFFLGAALATVLLGLRDWRLHSE